jgi:hypothetical protein
MNEAPRATVRFMKMSGGAPVSVSRVEMIKWWNAVDTFARMRTEQGIEEGLEAARKCEHDPGARWLTSLFPASDGVPRRQHVREVLSRHTDDRRGQKMSATEEAIAKPRRVLELHEAMLRRAREAIDA